jgi:hypothetical protein
LRRKSGTARPHLLFVALGAPKQEYWMYEHARSLGVPIAMGVGGSFEMVGGIVNRAPGWVQNMGIEWLYRLVREPRRLWRRYLIGNVQFGFIVLRQWLRLTQIKRKLIRAADRLWTRKVFVRRREPAAASFVRCLTKRGRRKPLRSRNAG